MFWIKRGLDKIISYRNDNINLSMEYEVVVSGAGPSGSTAAKFLAEKDINVLLVDKCKFPRDKVCGGAISPKFLDDFKYLKDKSDLFECTSRGGFVYSPSLKHVGKFENDNFPSIMVLSIRA